MFSWRLFNRIALSLLFAACLLAVPAAAQPGSQFTITGIEVKECCEAGRTVSITFSDKITANDAYSRLHFVPPVPSANEKLSSDDKVLIVHGQFRTGTTYSVRFSGGFVSASGKPYVASRQSFEVPHLPPALRFSGLGSVVERNSRQLVHFDVLNVDSTLLETVTVPPLTALALGFYGGKKTWDIESAASVSDLFKKELPGDSPLRAGVYEISQRKDVFDTKGKEDFEQSFSIPLSERPDKAKGQIVLARVLDNAKGKNTVSEPSIFNITDLGATLVSSNRETLVWVTSLTTGLPVKNVKIFAVCQDGWIFEAGNTDADGVLNIQGGDKNGVRVARTQSFLRKGLAESLESGTFPCLPDKIEAILAVTGDDVAIAATPANPAWRISFPGIRQTSSPSEQPRPANAQIFTERGVYRPGDKVFFKGTVRRYREGAIEPPAGDACNLEITDSRGRKIHESETPLSAFGTASGEFIVPPSSPLGEYRIEMRLKEGGQSAVTTFRVEEFQPPRHFARVGFAQEKRKDDSYVNRTVEMTFLKVTVEGGYYAGGPVKNGRVRWQLTYGPSAHQVADYEDYIFGHEGDRDTGERAEPLESGESFLDASGKLSLEFPVSREVLSGERNLVVSATVLDFDGKAASTTQSWQAPIPYQIGIMSHPGSISAEQEQQLRAIVIEKDGERIAKGTLSVEVLRQSWNYFRKRNLSGNEYWVSEQVWKRSSLTEVDISDSVAKYSVAFDWGGEYLVRFSYRAEDGGVYSSATRYNVNWGSWEDSYSSRDEQRYTKVSLAPDRNQYKPGQTARLRIGARRKATAYLYTLERQGILEYKVYTPKDGMQELEVKIKKDHLPNVFASLVGTIPRGSFPVYSGKIDDGFPTFMHGVTNLQVVTKSTGITVEIAPEKKILEAEPGQEVTLTLAATAEGSAGVQAELAVAVVDESVLALTGYRTPDLKGLTRFDIPLGVFLTDLRLFMLPQTPYRTVRNEALTGGSEGDGAPLETRKRFEPVAYWNPALLTGENGKATIRFTLPDQMSSFRVFVVACDKGSAFGNAERQLRVSKPFYLEPGLPRFFTKGDTFRFKVAAFNQTSESGALEFSLSQKGGLAVSTEQKSYPVKAMDRVDVAVSGRAEKPGDSVLLFSGAFGSRRDAVEMTLPVRTPHVSGQETWYGTLKGKANLAPALSETQKGLAADPELLAETRAVLTLSSSPFLRMTEGLRYLLQYPYGCVEQTSSGVMPLAVMKGLLAKGAVPGIRADEADPFLEKGVQRLLGMQTSSGGFGYWPGDREASPWGTFYALTALAEARDAGMSIPTPVIERAVEYLRTTRITKEPEEAGGPVALYLLARLGAANSSDFALFKDKIGSMDWEPRILTLLAASYGNFMATGELAESAKKAVSSPRKDSYYAHDFHAQYRSDALSLLLLDRAAPESGEAAKAAVKLLESRSKEGNWYRTSDTGWALSALARHFMAESPSSGQVSVTVLLPGEGEKTVSLPSQGYTEISVPVASLLANPSLSMSSDPAREILYSLRLVFPRADYAKGGHEGGFQISKRYETVEGSQKIKVGDLVKVTVEFSGPERDSRFVVLDDPLPAGLVAINTAFKTEEALPSDNDAQNSGGQNNEGYWYSFWNPEGFYRFVPDHLELRNDRVTAFRASIWTWRENPYRFTYYARAVCEGVFVIPPTKVERMYEPEINGYTPASALTIEGRP
ncbi:hypothetical protein EPN96_01140 [bacterium]|nr:MAG: hypothetical protein EPN96_01140 [bacterium]